MPKLSKLSKERLSTCHPSIQKVINEAILHYDFAVICGHRNKTEQDRAYHDGRSKLPWPKSNHNKEPSMAVDLAPYPVDWGNIQRFKALAEIVLNVSTAMGINLSWGGNWKTFKDYPHFELV